MMYNSSMLGDLKPLTRSPTQRQREPRCLKILEAMQMKCYDAMRDLRDKIGVLQMPLFKVILAGEVKVKIFVSTR